MAVKSADQPGLERRIVEPDGAGPTARNEEMPVGAFLFHIADAIGGIVVLHAGTG
jgi:hypothetical protein